MDGLVRRHTGRPRSVVRRCTGSRGPGCTAEGGTADARHRARRQSDAGSACEWTGPYLPQQAALAGHHRARYRTGVRHATEGTQARHRRAGRTSSRDAGNQTSATMKKLIPLALYGLLALGGCDADSSASSDASEVLAARPWRETLIADGEIKAAANTPLNVPGSGWENRVLVDMLAEGSAVRKGQVIARFDAPQARMQLAQADLELLRKTLAEQAIVSNAAVERATLAGDRAKVEDDLNLSQRYAQVDLSIFA